MKKKLIVKVLLVSLLLCTNWALAQHDSHANHSPAEQAGNKDSSGPGNSSALNQSMQSGMEKMMNMKMTGDADHDFATMLRMHHQSAVEMSDLELKHGKNAKIKELASKIKASNQKEITEIDQFLSSHKPQGSSSKLGEKAMEIMRSGTASTNQNMDHDYASLMAEHHRQGIEMARSFLQQGKTSTMKQMANKVISQQTKQEQELKKLQAQLASN